MDEIDTYFSKLEKMFDKIKCKKSQTTMGSVINEVKGLLQWLSQIHDSNSPPKAEFMVKKDRLLKIIYNIIEANGKAQEWSEEDIQEVKEMHKNRLYEIMGRNLPISKEDRKKKIAEVNRLKEIIDSSSLHEASKQRLYGPLSFFCELLKIQLVDSYSRRKMSGLFKGLKRRRKKRLSGNERKKIIIDPELLFVIAEMVKDVPEIWENVFLRRVMIENEFMDQIHMQLAIGTPFKKALKHTLSKINDKKIIKHLTDISNKVIAIEKDCYKIIDKERIVNGGSNILAFYQMEGAERYLNNVEPHLFVFDEPGTRKTITSVLSMILRLQKDGFRKANIIAIVPYHLLGGWEKEIEDRTFSSMVSTRIIHEDVLAGKKIKKAKLSPYHIDIVGQSVFSGNKRPPYYYDAHLGDEGHNWKQRGYNSLKGYSKRSKNILKYLSDAGIIYKIALTGTPLVNEVSEYANMINGFSGKEYFPIADLVAIPSEISQACWVHFQSCQVVLRRRRSSVLDLPTPVYCEEEVILGEKEYKKLNDLQNKKGHSFSLPDIARLESSFPQKIDKCVEIMNYPIHKKQKGMVYSFYVSGVEKGVDGVLELYYKACPSNRPKLYIDGKKVIDINGREDTYNYKNAKAVREQFENAKGAAMAYVSIGTSREGICNFAVADFLIHACLPFEPASWEQANTRIDRCGRNKNVSPYLYILKNVYRNKNGTNLYCKNRIVKSFDESCIKLIRRKKKIMNAACDGVKREMNGEIEGWDVSDDKFPFKKLLDNWANGMGKKNPLTKFNSKKILVTSLSEIEHIPWQHEEDIENAIEGYNKEMKKHDVDANDFHEGMEGLSTAKDSNKIALDLMKKLFPNGKINIMQVGCGKSLLMNKIKKLLKKRLGKTYRIDKYCAEKGIICCDRSEVHEHCKVDSINYIIASNVLHWGATLHEISKEEEGMAVDNISNTMMSFNESLQTEGYLLLTCPEPYEYPFASNKKFLKEKGFELKKESASGSIRYYLLKKIQSHKNGKLMSKRLLPVKPLRID